MSLGFYTDQALTRPINQSRLKRFCVPLSGGTRESVVYIGDPFFSLLAVTANVSDAIVSLQDTSEFLDSGTAILNGIAFTYTSKNSNSLQGCVGVPAAPILSKVTPSKVYKASGNIVVTPIGSGFSTDFNVQLSTNFPTVPYGFSQSAAIYTQTSFQTGQSLPLYVKVNVNVGVEEEIVNWNLVTSGLAVRDISDTTPIAPTEGLEQAVMYGYVFRGLQSPVLHQRVIQLNREITNLNPGFTIGKYRWRTSATINGFAFIPPNWNLDPIVIGTSKFQSGIGYAGDLEMVDLVNEDTSIYPILNNGQYFYGPYRNYLPSTTVVEILDTTFVGHTLQQLPTSQAPIQVGIWKFDTNNVYVPYQVFTQVATITNTDGSARTDLPANYFTFDRRNNNLLLNQTLGNQTAFVGNLTDLTTTFELPYYPIDTILSAYVDYGGVKPRAYATLINIDSDSRQVTITIPDASVGDSVYIFFPLKVACIYDVGVKGSTRTETSIDVNPAYAGISNGFYYIEQRIRRTGSIVLTCDKPVIDIPATFSSVLDLKAYGPVYTVNDYALLTGQAYTSVSGEVMPNASLKVIPGDNFSGLINYLDPTVEDVIVITGGDGKANMVYTPQGFGGYYIPATAPTGSLAGITTTTVTDDTLVLPVGIPISQLWNASDGWSVFTYKVFNDKPFYGQIDANLALGEIPYVTSGTPGTANFKSNGMLSAIQNGSDTVHPLNAFDTSNRSYTDPLFNGEVIKLVYLNSLTTGSDIPAYYINFLQRVTLKLQDIDTGIFSNSVLLQMQFPTVIDDNPWLYLDNATSGIINSFRLGWISPGV